MKHYYNEFDPGAAQWLRNLITAGKLPAGEVDERDIRLVQPADLRGFVQCHFFAGIGGWPIALRLAGWSEERPVWTGSCPCQPFSVCGKRKKDKDDRHLWPEFKRLISECRPPVVFGEQVASKDGVEWLAGVRSDLEACGYAVGGADLPAASIKAPHIRQRLWFVADAAKPIVRQVAPAGDERGHGSDDQAAVGLADSSFPGLQERGGNGRVQREAGRSSKGETALLCGDIGGVADTQDAHGRGGKRLQEEGTRQEEQRGRGPSGGSSYGNLEHAAGEQVGLPRLARKPRSPGYWDVFDIVQCTDGKARRIESGTFPLAHGIPARVVKLRAYGNAIIPELAAEFIMAYMEVRTI